MMSIPDFREKQILFVNLRYGEKLSFGNGNLVLRDCEGQIKLQASCYRLFAVFVVGSLTITDQLLLNARRFGFSIHFLKSTLKPFGSWNAGAEGNTLLRRKQYLSVRDDIAQFLVCNKLKNQAAVIGRIRDKSEAMKTARDRIGSYLEALDGKDFASEELLTIEAHAAKLYFKALFEEFGFAGRRPRVRADILNALLDTAYSMLFNLVESMLSIYGFDLYCGVYHKTFYQRKSLVCDLIEPFRCIVEARIRKAYRLGQINPDDFKKINNEYTLFGTDSKKYIAIVFEEILEHKEAVFKFVQSYYRCFMKDVPGKQFKYFDYKENVCL